MGCGSSVSVETVEAPTKQPPNQDSLNSLVVLQKENAEDIAELLTLGASEGIVHSSYIIGQKLGDGNYATVCRAKHIATKRQVAIKIINLGAESKKSLRAKAPFVPGKKVQGKRDIIPGSMRYEGTAYSLRGDAFRSASSIQAGDVRNSMSQFQASLSIATPRETSGSGRAMEVEWGNVIEVPSGRWDESFDMDSIARANLVAGTAKAAPAATEELKMICREISILRSLDHPSIVKFHEYFLSPKRNRVFIVMQLLEGGDLVTALTKRRNNTYTEADAAKVFAPVLRGLEYLHSKGVVHRDMKLDNLLLEDENDLSSTRIADFGMAKRLYERRNGLEDANLTLCGTPAYMSPEMLNVDSAPATSASDMWSAGVILHLLLTGTLPFVDENVEKLYAKIRLAEVDMSSKSWEGVSDLAQSLVAGLLDRDPATRLTAAEAVNHEWIKGAGSWLLCAPESFVKKQLREHILATWQSSQIIRDRDYLMRQGEPCPFVFFVLKGIVEVFCEANLLGPEVVGSPSVVPLGRCAAGEYVGELSLLDPEALADRLGPGLDAKNRDLPSLRSVESQTPPCPISVRACGDVQVLLIRAEDLRAHVECTPAAGDAVLAEAHTRLEWVEQRLQKARAWRNGAVHRQNVTSHRSKAWRATATGNDWSAQLPKGGASPSMGTRKRLTLRDRARSMESVRPAPESAAAGGSPAASLMVPHAVIYEGRESVSAILRRSFLDRPQQSQDDALPPATRASLLNGLQRGTAPGGEAPQPQPQSPRHAAEVGEGRVSGGAGGAVEGGAQRGPVALGSSDEFPRVLPKKYYSVNGTEAA